MGYTVTVKGRGYSPLQRALDDGWVRLDDTVILSGRDRYTFDHASRLAHEPQSVVLKMGKQPEEHPLETTVRMRAWKVTVRG